MVRLVVKLSCFTASCWRELVVKGAAGRCCRSFTAQSFTA